MSSPPAQVHHQTKERTGRSGGGHRAGAGDTSSRSGTLSRAYLATYNVLSAAGWALVLYRTLAHLLALSSPTPTAVAASSAGGRASSLFASLKPSGHPLVWIPSIVPARFVPLYVRACTAYDAVGSTTARVQSAAVLEVLHVLVGLVRSPLPTTAVQVASRLFSVWCIAARFPSAQRSPFYASMVLSWALTEVIRYTFYAASIVGWEFAPLLWARYSTFFVLYPTGAGSEALVNLATLPISVASGGSWFSILPFEQWDPYALLRGVLFVAWWPGLYPMYTHMIKQRRKVFGGQRLGARPKTQ